MAEPQFAPASMTADVRTRLADYLEGLAFRLEGARNAGDEEAEAAIERELHEVADQLRSHNLVPGATTITSYDGGDQSTAEEGLTLRSNSGEPN
jgi:hypothetical protein